MMATITINVGARLRACTTQRDYKSRDSRCVDRLRDVSTCASMLPLATFLSSPNRRRTPFASVKVYRIMQTISNIHVQRLCIPYPSEPSCLKANYYNNLIGLASPFPSRGRDLYIFLNILKLGKVLMISQIHLEI